MLFHQKRIHPNGYWIGDTKHFFDKPLATELISVFKGHSVVDLGCGNGSYVNFLANKGIDIKGVDGNPIVCHYPLCSVADLAKELDLGVFDWVLSLEVGEHIPKQHEDQFIENVHKHNTLGVVISWAIKGQAGQGHVNCQNNAYIKDRFKTLGYTNDVALETNLRRVASLRWMKNTVMVFTKYPLSDLNRCYRTENPAS